MGHVKDWTVFLMLDCQNKMISVLFSFTRKLFCYNITVPTYNDSYNLCTNSIGMISVTKRLIQCYVIYVTVERKSLNKRMHTLTERDRAKNKSLWYPTSDTCS